MDRIDKTRLLAFLSEESARVGRLRLDGLMSRAELVASEIQLAAIRIEVESGRLDAEAG